MEARIVQTVIAEILPDSGKILPVCALDPPARLGIRRGALR